MKAKTNSEKTNLHPRNSHRFGYDFTLLMESCPELKPFVFINAYQNQTIDFSNADAVKILNKALLIKDYGIENWDIPANYLCSPIPGRADYIHYVADLLASTNNDVIPRGETVQGLDVGIGSNAIYPLLGNALFDWSFVGTDIDEKALQNCKQIISNNPKLMDAISLQLQVEARFLFKNIITSEDLFAFTICNPPFHASAEEANKANLRKINSLQNTKTGTPALNFNGQNRELWCDGGEIGFITQMIFESVKYPKQVLWFTTLVSKRDNLSSIYKTLNKVNAVEIKTIEMAQGQKTSRIIAWTFMTKSQQENWKF
jgi:23S rRNA (adenine1618-N6)-methyltransferase